jgi:hypothetical protein
VCARVCGGKKLLTSTSLDGNKKFVTVRHSNGCPQSTVPVVIRQPSKFKTLCLGGLKITTVCVTSELKGSAAFLPDGGGGQQKKS